MQLGQAPVGASAGGEDTPPALWPRPKGELLLFLAVFGAYLLWRSPGDLVWDDSPSVCENVYELNGRYSFSSPQLLSAIFREAFGQVNPDGYRPLNWVVRRLGLACFPDPAASTLPFLLINGALAGCLAVSFFRLARRFTPTPVGAGFAVLLFLVTTPVLTGLLVLFTGIQILVPLLMCLALNAYFRVVERGGLLPGLALALVLFVGPWYREFLGITALLVLFAEAQRGRWRSGVALLAVLGFAHALFPTALWHLTIFPDLPLQAVYRLGELGRQVSRRTADAPLLLQLVSALPGLHWRIFLDLFGILPPTLCLAAAWGWWLPTWRGGTPAVPRGLGLFLLFFFLVTFLPFLKVFKEQVHLTYCLLPACIFLAASGEALVRTLATAPRIRAAAAALLVVGAADLCINPFVVRAATLRCYEAIRDVAAFCERTMPPGSVLLANPHHARDVELFCRGRFTCYYTALTSGNFPKWVQDVADLRALTAREAGKAMFCLEARLPAHADQLGADRGHWAVHGSHLDLEPHGRIKRVCFRYPVLDPFKLLLPTRNVSWPSSPDLEFDYYRGPSLNRRWWLREVSVNYFFYRVRGGKVHARGVSDRSSPGAGGWAGRE